MSNISICFCREIRKFFLFRSKPFNYGKCLKKWNTNASDKMTYANNAYPDQTAPKQSDQGRHCLPIH